MGALSQNSTFTDLVDKSDEKIVAALTDTNQRGRMEFTVIYTATSQGGAITVSREMRVQTSVTDSGVKDVSV
jgi:hypothetical protein